MQWIRDRLAAMRPGQRILAGLVAVGAVLLLAWLLVALAGSKLGGRGTLPIDTAWLRQLAFRWSLAAELSSTRWLLDLAAASYGIYLLHQPLLSYANDFLASTLSPEVRFAVLLIGIGLVCYKAAVFLNILLYRLFR